MAERMMITDELLAAFLDGNVSGMETEAILEAAAHDSSLREFLAIAADVSDHAPEVRSPLMEFDVIVATPDMMGQLGKLVRILGPKGLMPNPKTGTVTMDVAKAIKEIKAGKVEYRPDKIGNIQMTIGKVSFGPEKLRENLKAVYDALMKVRPSTVKGAYMKNVSVASTMGPGVKVDVESINRK